MLETKHSSDSCAQIVEGKDAPRSGHERSSWWQGGAWLRVLLDSMAAVSQNLGHWLKDTVAQVCHYLRDSL